MLELSNEEDRVKKCIADARLATTTFNAQAIQAKLWLQAEEFSQFADVEISFSDGTKLRAHRCVLTLASACFDRSIYSVLQKASTLCWVCGKPHYLHSALCMRTRLLHAYLALLCARDTVSQ